MSDCIFCKIIKGEIPSYKIYEDNDVLAFLDIAPISKGHTLVIPKEHFSNFEEIPEVLLCKVIKVVKKIGKSIKENLKVEGYSQSVNNDPVAGQIIPHIHFHIIPRSKGDGLELWPQNSYVDGEADVIVEKIKI